MLGKITFIGAVFLGIVAVLPIVLGTVTGVNISLGGTSLLIVVGVAPVSYTHLDVYKRQDYRKPTPRKLLPL